MYALLKRKLASFMASVVIGLVAGGVSIALASLTFTGSNISGNGPLVIDGSSTISIGTSTATSITIGNSSSTVSFPGTVAVGTTIMYANGTGVMHPNAFPAGSGAVWKVTAPPGPGPTDSRFSDYVGLTLDKTTSQYPAIWAKDTTNGFGTKMQLWTTVAGGGYISVDGSYYSANGITLNGGNATGLGTLDYTIHIPVDVLGHSYDQNGGYQIADMVDTQHGIMMGAGSNTTDILLALDKDGYYRYALGPDGHQYWGSGTLNNSILSNFDTDLYRSGASALRTKASLTVDGALSVGGTIDAHTVGATFDHVVATAADSHLRSLALDANLTIGVGAQINTAGNDNLRLNAGAAAAILFSANNVALGSIQAAGGGQLSGYGQSLQTPASSVANCTAGQVEWDASFIYVCTASNNWKRAALLTF